MRGGGGGGNFLTEVVLMGSCLLGTIIDGGGSQLGIFKGFIVIAVGV